MVRLEGTTPSDIVDRILEEIPAQEKSLPDSLSAAKVK